jgi:hypothetical protein
LNSLQVIEQPQASWAGITYPNSAAHASLETRLASLPIQPHLDPPPWHLEHAQPERRVFDFVWPLIDVDDRAVAAVIEAVNHEPAHTLLAHVVAERWAGWLRV